MRHDLPIADNLSLTRRHDDLTFMIDPKHSARLLHGKRCLVLEDEFLIAIDIEGILQSAGAESVVCAINPEDALKEIAAQEFDFAVLDLKIAHATSLEVAEALAERAVPFIFATGAPDGTASLPKFHDVPVLEKPFEVKALLQLLAKFFPPR